MENKPEKSTNANKKASRSRGDYGEGTIYQRKDGRYVASIWLPGGKRIQRYAQTRKEAREKLKQAMRELEQNQLTTERDTSFSIYLDYWLKMRRDSLTIKQSTYCSYQSYLHRHVFPIIGNIMLQKITGVQIQHMYTKLRQQGLSPNTVHIVHAILNAAFNDAVKWRRISHNPCQDLTPPKLSYREMKFLNQEQAIQLLEAAKNYHIETLLLLAVSLGIRKGELFGLHWDDIDFDHGVLQIRRTVSYIPPADGEKHTHIETDPKTSHSKRKIILPPFIIEALKKHQLQQKQARLKKGEKWQNLQLVFSNDRGGYHDHGTITKKFKQVLLHAGLPDMRFHDLRHSAATILLAMGVNVKVIQELLGHANISITLGIYSHVTPDMQSSAMNALDESYQRLLQPKKEDQSGHTHG